MNIISDFKERKKFHIDHLSEVLKDMKGHNAPNEIISDQKKLIAKIKKTKNMNELDRVFRNIPD